MSTLIVIGFVILLIVFIIIIRYKRKRDRDHWNELDEIIKVIAHSDSKDKLEEAKQKIQEIRSAGFDSQYILGATFVLNKLIEEINKQ